MNEDYIDDSFSVGDIVVLAFNDGTNIPRFKKENGNNYGGYIHLDNLDLITEPKTLDNLEEGDVVNDGSDSDKEERTIMFVLKPGLYIVSDWGNELVNPTLFSTQDFEEFGYKVKQPTSTELTDLEKEYKETMDKANKLNGKIRALKNKGGDL